MPESATARRRPAVPAILLLAALSAVVILLGGAGQSVWLCLPGALLAAALARTRRGAAAAAGLVIGLAIVISAGVGTAGRSASPLLLVVVGTACAAVLVALRERLERDRALLREFALSDPVTGVANRRSLMIRADYEIARHRRAQRSFVLVMVDLDGFKGLNDRFGHAAGDDLLRDVAASLQRAMRAQDTVARFGGDEFCVLAPETEEAGGGRLAARVDGAIRRVSVGMADSAGVSGSAGVAIFPHDGVTVAELMAVADARLLEAKRRLYGTRPGRASRRAA